LRVGNAKIDIDFERTFNGNVAVNLVDMQGEIEVVVGVTEANI
jgi:hypothetical protein